MLALITAALEALTAACQAYSSWTKYQIANHVDELENEIERNLNIHTPSGDQRAAVLSDRIKRCQLKP